MSPQTDSVLATSDIRTDSAPTPDAEPIPPWTSVLTPVSYENRLRRGVPSRGSLRAVFLTDSDERAEALKSTLTTPRVPEGIQSWSVWTSPDTDAVRDALGDSSTDILYCGLPVEAGSIVARDGRVEVGSIAGSDGAPAAGVVAFEGTPATGVGVATVDSGALGAVVFDGSLPSESVRRLVAILSAGGPVSIAAALALRGEDTRARIVGDPSTAVSMNQGFALQLLSLRSLDTDSLTVERWSFVSSETMLGLECSIMADCLDERNQLAGTRTEEPEPIGVSDVLNLHSGVGVQVCLNDDLVLQSDDLTAEDVEKSARRALSDAAEAKPGADTESPN